MARRPRSARAPVNMKCDERTPLTVARVVDMETEGRGVRTTVVRLGPTLTDFAGDWVPGTFEHLVEIWPRFGIQRHFNTVEPADIADVVVHALTAPAHVRHDTIEVQPVAPPRAPDVP